jgi:hypothetical protein
MGHVQCLGKGDQLQCLEARAPHDDLKLIVVVRQGGRCSHLWLGGIHHCRRVSSSHGAANCSHVRRGDNIGSGSPASDVAPTAESWGPSPLVVPWDPDPWGQGVTFCHTQFLCQNQVFIVCMTYDQLFHTYS